MKRELSCGHGGADRRTGIHGSWSWNMTDVQIDEALEREKLRYEVDKL